MLEPSPVEKLLREAEEKTRDYQWLDASEDYEKVFRSIDSNRDPLDAGRVSALLARCFVEAAFQAKTRTTFKERMVHAKEAYAHAQRFYEKSGKESSSLLSNGKVVFARFWISDGFLERKALIEQAIAIARNAASTAERNGDKESLASAHKDLALYYERALEFSREFKPLKELVENALAIDEKAVAEYRSLDDPQGLLECMEHLAQLLTVSHSFTHRDNRENTRRAETLEREMTELAGIIGTPYARLLAIGVEASLALEIRGDSHWGLVLAEEAFPIAEKVGDKGLMGRVSGGIVSALFWSAIGEEDSEKRRALLERGVEEAQRAIRLLEIPLLFFPVDYARQAFAECHTMLAVLVETDGEKRKTLLRKAVEIAREAADENASWGRWGSSHALSKALLFLSQLDLDEDERTTLLKESLEVRKQTINQVEALLGEDAWDLGVQHNYLALAKSDLSNFEKTQEKKLELLQGAALDMEKCLRICNAARPTRGQFAALAKYEEWAGDLYVKIHDLRPAIESVERAVTVYLKSIDHYDRFDHPASTAHIRWKIARIQDSAGIFGKAAREFREAGEGYRLASKKIPGSLSFFNEMATYMDAWAFIEEARHRHNEEQYLLAAENYQKTAELLTGTRRWSFLSKHYSGCSFLEGGEALSRQERPESSRESFIAAVAAFREAKPGIEAQLKQNVDSDILAETRRWIEINESRGRYCNARVELEEAKMLDKKGEKTSSSNKYQAASEAFKTMSLETQNPQAREELETLHLLCKAWSRMKDAEAKASPDLYEEAAQIFHATEKTASNEKVRILAMANASICKALKAGTKFRRTRNTELYGGIKKRLETSADYYREAGFKNAADWTRATERMFDALVYLTDAEVERDPKKKTELYHLAEKHLQLAAKLYGEAGFLAKKEEALEHLERVREEKELLLTPLNALTGNPVASSTSVAPVSLVRDQAVGVERFEDANIVGSLQVSQTELPVGSNFTLRLDLVNVGKTSATLMKLEEIRPDGLELDANNMNMGKDGQFIDLKGRRLESLKTHELIVSLKAGRKGSYVLKPKVRFVDENSRYKQYEFEPVSLTVTELGIAGWLKGPK